MTQSTFFKTLTAFAAGLLVLACTPTVIPELSLSDLAANFEATGALEKTVSVTSNVDWTVSCPDAWVTVSPSSGTGNGTFKISVQENKAFEARTSTVTVKAGDKSSTVKVSQLGLTPSILVAPATLEVDAAGGTVSVDVTSNSPWTVSVPADGSWAAPDATSGEGNKKVTFTVAPNTEFAARSVDVTFTAQDKKATVKITQKAPDPTLAVSPATLSVGDEGGVLEFDVTSNAPWTVTAAEDWITVDPASGQGDAKVTLTVAPSDVRTVRSAVITVKETVGNSEKTVTVNQNAVPLGHKADSLALVAIYNAINEAGWKEDKKWDLTKPVSEWASGIKLNAEGRVYQVSFSTQLADAFWTLPEAVGDLTELTTLKLNKNVKGQLPESVYTLAKLEKFYFENGDLEGSLPQKIGQMTALTEIYVDGNAKLQGSIPASIGQLTKLTKISVSNTAVSGSIPAGLANCTALTDINAVNTKLSGELPDIWGGMTALKTLMLSGNDGLTGPLPASLGNLTKLTGIQLQNCNFTGNIPVEWANLPVTCKTLMVYGNKLSGVVPATVQAHTNWQAASAWKYETNILPQQEGYGLTLHSGSGGQDLDQPVDENPWN